MNDVDIEMIEMAEAGAMAASGVCSICEEALDPLDARWAGTDWGRMRLVDGSYQPATAVHVAECVGPVHPSLPYHVTCLEDQ